MTVSIAGGVGLRLWARSKQRRRSGSRAVLPGFRPTITFTLVYLAVLVLIPLSMLFLKAGALSFDRFVSVAFNPRAIAAYRLSLGTAGIAAVINGVFGVATAWALVRYRFRGRDLADALIDVPFALPTAVSGIALTTLLSQNGLYGQLLAHAGIQGAFSPFGITAALTFVGFPFVVRIVQPVLQDLDPGLEEAAATMGATRWFTFRTVLFPELRRAILAGVVLAFARALGEYGSIVFIAGNMPFKTEIAPLLIMTRLEEYDYPGAAAIAVVLLTTSLGLLIMIGRLQRRWEAP
jgi:sulfate/thiosulfate transport system permease protein